MSWSGDWGALGLFLSVLWSSGPFFSSLNSSCFVFHLTCFTDGIDTGNIVLKIFSFHLNDVDITTIPNGSFCSLYVHIYSGILLSTLKKPIT